MANESWYNKVFWQLDKFVQIHSHFQHPTQIWYKFWTSIYLVKAMGQWILVLLESKMTKTISKNTYNFDTLRNGIQSKNTSQSKKMLEISFNLLKVSKLWIQFCRLLKLKVLFWQILLDVQPPRCTRIHWQIAFINNNKKYVAGTCWRQWFLCEIAPNFY